MSMDSATSESFQSSNGGGDLDDFDSRPPPDPISSFLNLPPPQPPPSIPQLTPRTIFDPFPSYHTNSFLSDLDASTWPPPPPQPPLPPPPPPNSTSTAASSSVVASAAPRASKKRARASRRAPTTVLTTDTSNFRAMVQEFTGIPAPPFTASSVFSRPRLDLFHPSASASTPGFLLRPFAQKRQATGPPGISSNTLPSTNSIQNQSQSQSFLLNSQNHPSLNLQALLQEQQRAMALCQWPAGGYAGGELGSVIAGASGEADSKRIGSCKADHAGSTSQSEKQAAAEGFSTAAAAPARGEGGVDAWQLSSD